MAPRRHPRLSPPAIVDVFADCSHTCIVVVLFGCCYCYCNGRRYNNISGERRDLERKIVPDSYVGEELRVIPTTLSFFSFFFNWARGKFFDCFPRYLKVHQKTLYPSHRGTANAGFRT